METLVEPVKTTKRTQIPANRLLLRREYIRGLGSIAVLCAKHGISTNTASEWATNEKWSALRAKWLERQEQEDLVTQPAPEQPPLLNGDFQKTRIPRVREQIQQLDSLFETESDPQKLDRLASALARLYEIERLASGRPLPGSMRPSPAPTRRQSQAYTAPMIEDDVAPQPAPAAAKPQTYTGPETG